jgi:hypothetical protein
MRLDDKTLRRRAAAQVQLRQHDSPRSRSATHKKGTYVAKNVFRDIIGRLATKSQSEGVDDASLTLPTRRKLTLMSRKM